jgi:hypothetical protein
VTRLIHLNGPPGIGKSTLARRYVADHPKTLNCDIDVLRTLVGGWKEDFAQAGALMRPAALAMIEAYLRTGQDVVLPQMLVDLDQLARFEACATNAGATFSERVLMDRRDAAVRRFHRRGATGPADPWHEEVRAIVAASGGDAVLAHYHSALEHLLRERPQAVMVRSVEDSTEETYRALIDSLSGRRPA